MNISRPLRKSGGKQELDDENCNDNSEKSDVFIYKFHQMVNDRISKKYETKIYKNPEDDIFKKPKNQLIRCFNISTECVVDEDIIIKNETDKRYRVNWIYFSGWEKEEYETLDEIFQFCIKKNIPINQTFKNLLKKQNETIINKLSQIIDPNVI